MAYENLIYEKKGHIAVITGNRPAAMNANNLGMTREKRLAFLDFENDPGLWVCIYTGAGERAFCAGGDLKERAQNYEDFLERRKHPNPLMSPGHLTCDRSRQRLCSWRRFRGGPLLRRHHSRRPR